MALPSLSRLLKRRMGRGDDEGREDGGSLIDLVRMVSLAPRMVG